MTSRRARERADARPWEAGEQPDPDDQEIPERCPDTDDMFGGDDAKPLRDA